MTPLEKIADAWITIFGYLFLVVLPVAFVTAVAVWKLL